MSLRGFKLYIIFFFIAVLCETFIVFLDGELIGLFLDCFLLQIWEFDCGGEYREGMAGSYFP